MQKRDRFGSVQNSAPQQQQHATCPAMHARAAGQPGSLARRSTSVTSVSAADPLDGAAHSGVGDLGVYLTDEPGKACSG